MATGITVPIHIVVSIVMRVDTLIGAYMNGSKIEVKPFKSIWVLVEHENRTRDSFYKLLNIYGVDDIRIAPKKVYKYAYPYEGLVCVSNDFYETDEDFMYAMDNFDDVDRTIPEFQRLEFTEKVIP